MSNNQDTRQLMQNAFNKIRALNNEIIQLKADKSEPIAIVGIGCRLPGSSNNVEEYWRNLLAAKNAVVDMETQRWQHKKFFQAGHPVKGKTYSPKAGLVDDILRFDADAFKITPREVECMDPQQRQLLEVTWEALENAGMPLEQIKGSNAGVFVGVMNKDHSDLMVNQLSNDQIIAQMNTGNHDSVLSGRLSYFFDFKGPSFTLNTACSSSLLTVHLACQSLRSNECDFAVAGGCNLILSPTSSIAQSQARMHSTSGYCKTFDESADGYVRSEGVGIVVLKTLSKALKDNDNIYCLIKGSATNQDGLSQGISAPNGPSQERVMLAALANAGVNAKDIAYVESHGTGTKLGDPIEARSLGSVYGRAKNRNKPLLVGAVKSNIGHAESAAGVASLIKTAKIVQTGIIPQNLHCTRVNPHIDLAYENLALCEQKQIWQQDDNKSPMLAGISSFGFSGTNVHLILAAYNKKSSALTLQTEANRNYHLLRVSGKTEQALLKNVAIAADFITNSNVDEIANICFSYNVGRSDFEHSILVHGSDKLALAESLKLAASHYIPSPKKATTNALFHFGKIGLRELAICKRFYWSNKVFKIAYDSLSTQLKQQLPIDESIMLDASSAIPSALTEGNASEQAILCHYALFQMWQSLGFTPELVSNEIEQQDIILLIVNNAAIDEIASALFAKSTSTVSYLANPIILHNDTDAGFRLGSVQIDNSIKIAEQSNIGKIVFLGVKSQFPESLIDKHLVFSGFINNNPSSPWLEIATQFVRAHSTGQRLSLSQWHDQELAKIPVPTYAFQGERYWLDLLDMSAIDSNTNTNAEENSDLNSDATSASDFALNTIAKLSKKQASTIDKKAVLMADMGFDSLMIMELREALVTRYPSLSIIPFETLYESDVSQLLEYVSREAKEGLNAMPVANEEEIANELRAALTWIKQWKPKYKRVDKHLVHKYAEHNVLVGEMSSIDGDKWYVAQMYHDANHPFFYEHPQDHVPGLYLIEAVRQFGLACAHRFHNVPLSNPFVLDEMSIKFDSFAESNSAIYMLATYTDKLIVDNVLHRTNSTCYLIQAGKVIGKISGKGLIMKTDNYQEKRLKEAV